VTTQPVNPPVFTVTPNGEPDDAAIRALASLLIAHAKRELEAERHTGDQDTEERRTR
jgi:hypothetical protein